MATGGRASPACATRRRVEADMDKMYYVAADGPLLCLLSSRLSLPSPETTTLRQHQMSNPGCNEPQP